MVYLFVASGHGKVIKYILKVRKKIVERLWSGNTAKIRMENMTDNIKGAAGKNAAGGSKIGFSHYVRCAVLEKRVA